MPDSQPASLLSEHTDDCRELGFVCLEPDRSNLHFNQPPRGYVTEAEDELGDDAPWCQVQALAFELMSEAESEEDESEPS